MRAHRIIHTLICLQTAGVLSARNFHIDPQGGDDHADASSPRTAWHSAAGLRDHPLQPGDRVLFRSGTSHVGKVVLSGAGTRELPIRVGRYGGGPFPVIEGAGADAALLWKDPSFGVVEELEITNRANDGKSRHGVLVTASCGGTREGMLLRRLHVHDVCGNDERGGGSGIIFDVRRAADGRPTRFHDLRVEHCWLHQVPFNGIFLSAFDDRVRDATGKHPAASTGVVIRGNLFQEVAGDAICIINTEKALIEHNEVYRSSFGQTRGAHTPSAGIWPHTSDGTVVRMNRVEGLRGNKDGQAYDVDIDCRDTLVENNVSRNNGTGFLLLCSNSRERPDMATTGTVIRNNLSLNDAVEAPGALVTIVSSVHGVLFENNAFVNTLGGKRRFLQMGKWLDETWPADIRWKGNLFACSGTFDASGETKQNRFEGNFWQTVFTHLPDDSAGVHGNPMFRANPVTTFDTALRLHSPALAVGFRPFALADAGLPPDSPWLSQRGKEATQK